MLIAIVVFVLYVDLLALTAGAYIKGIMTLWVLLCFYFGATVCVAIARECILSIYAQPCCSKCKCICPSYANYCRYCGEKLQ